MRIETGNLNNNSVPKVDYTPKAIRIFTRVPEIPKRTKESLFKRATNIFKKL